MGVSCGREREYEYDVGLSFAGEQREYVEDVADELASRGIRPFYDNYERSSLWGKDLYAHLSEVYQYKFRFCVIFVSKEYAAKVWPNRERQSAQARALEEKWEYILPARFDDTGVPGLLDTVFYVDLNQTTPVGLCDLIAEKLGKNVRRNYLPPTLDRLYERLGIENDRAVQRVVISQARSFLDKLNRMDSDERYAVTSLIRYGCRDHLPEDIHIDVDLLQRETGKSAATLERLLGGVRSLGFHCSISDASERDPDLSGTLLGDDPFYFNLNWVDLAIRDEFVDDELPDLEVASEMILGAAEGYCRECGSEYLERLDFSQLATATATEETH